MNITFTQPTRQSPWAIVFILGTYALFVARQLWPVFIVFFIRPNTDKTLWFIGAVLVMAVFMLIFAIINHFYYRFWIDGDRLIIHSGWLQKAKKTIPLERIQSLNLEQTMVHRLTGTTKIIVETAGATGAEVSIRALDMTKAEALRTLLFKSGLQQNRTSETVEQETEQPVSETILFTLTPWDLFKTGLSQNHLRTIGVVLLLMVGLWDDVQNQFNVFSEDQLEQAGQALQSMMVILIVFGLIGIGVVIASVVRIMVQYADLAVYVDGARFRIHSGLLTIREVVVSGQKLQSLTWTQNPIQRLFGLFKLEFSQALAELSRGQKHVMIPGMYAGQLDQIHELVFPEESREPGSWHGIDPRYRWFRWFWIGFMPGLIAAVLLWGVEPILAGWAGVWIGWYWFASGRRTRRWRWFVNKDILILRRGWLTSRVTLLPTFKIQSASLHASPMQRRLGLRTITLHTASGTELIPWLPLAEAERLRDWCLFRVEKDERGWM